MSIGHYLTISGSKTEKFNDATISEITCTWSTNPIFTNPQYILERVKIVSDFY